MSEALPRAKKHFFFSLLPGAQACWTNATGWWDLRVFSGSFVPSSTGQRSWPCVCYFQCSRPTQTLAAGCSTKRQNCSESATAGRLCVAEWCRVWPRKSVPFLSTVFFFPQLYSARCCLYPCLSAQCISPERQVAKVQKQADCRQVRY